MPSFKNLVGLRFEKLQVVAYGGRIKGCHAWVCMCDCGNTIRTISASLNNGNTTSCGCKCWMPLVKHGESHKRTHEYKCWYHMKDRCLNPNHSAYQYYGGRGITICEKWLSYEGFLEDMGRAPSHKYTLDRIETDGNYVKSNCRWADHHTQMNNTRRTIKFNYNGITMSLKQWAKHFGVNYTTACRRNKAGKSFQQIFLVPNG